MSYAALIKKLPKIIRQPTGLAVFGSLGIHGIVLSILPVLQLDSPPLAAQARTVGFIQLTPEEQSRLPQPATPSSNYQLNDSSKTPNYSVVPPLPPAPTVIPPLPPISALPSTSSSTPSQINPSTNEFQSGSLLPPLPPPGLLAPPNGTTLPKYPLSGSQSSTTVSPTQPNSNQTQTGKSSLPFQPPPNLGLPNVPLTSQPFIPPPDNALNPTTPTPAPETSPDTAAVRRKKLIALLEEQRQKSALANPNTPENTESTTPPPTTPSDQQQRNAMIEEYTKRQTRLQANNPEIQTKAPIYKTIPICQKQLEGTAVVGVVVNPQGSITDGPDFIRLTNTDIKQAAENYVKSYVKSLGAGTSKPINYQFNLQYKYDTSCNIGSKPTVGKVNNGVAPGTNPKSKLP